MVVSKLSPPEKEALRIWKSGKGINAQIPHELECEACGQRVKSSECRDLKLYEADKRTMTMKMDVACPTPLCPSRISFIAPYEKPKRKKANVRPKVR